MSSIEFKVKKIFLYEEAKVLGDFSMFGWKPVKREILDNSPIAPLCRVVLTFERDTSINNYAEITELERVYNSISEPTLVSCRPSGMLVLCCFLSLILGVVLFMFAAENGMRLLMLAGIALTFLGEIATPFVIYRYAKLKSGYDDEFYKYSICLDIFKEKESEISEKAKMLM